MPKGFRRAPEQSSSGETPLSACEATIGSTKAKADWNERLARWVTGVIVVGSSLIPVSIIASSQADAFLLGKLVPAVLAMGSAIAAGVLQFERPHDRWRLYRGYQRAFEDKRLRYLNRLSPFDTPDAAMREQLFGEQVAALRIQLHNDWSGVLPASDSVVAALGGTLSPNP